MKILIKTQWIYNFYFYLYIFTLLSKFFTMDIYSFNNKNENIMEKYYGICGQMGTISKAGFVLRNSITLGEFLIWGSVSLYCRHLKALDWELHRTVCTSLTYRRSPCILYPRSEDPCGKMLASSERPPTCWVDHWTFWDWTPDRLDTKARARLLGRRTPRSSHEKLLWRALADYCPAHVTFAYHSNASQSPLEIPDWFHWWITCYLHCLGQENWHLGQPEKKEKYQRTGAGCWHV